MINYVWNEVVQKPMPKLITVRISKEYGMDVYGYDVRKWMKENCQHNYYMLPAWCGVGYQFEDDEDAALFALRWS